ncbi:transmembrane sensor [Pedobacter sp. UYEF25]
MADFNLTSEEIFHVSLILEDKQGSISPVEEKELQEWRSLNGANNLLYKEISHVDTQLNLYSVYQKLDVEHSLLHLNKKLMQHEISQKVKARKNLVLKFIAMAACFFVVCAAIFYVSYGMDNVKIETSALESKSFILPDKSTITLNGNTLITYSKKKFENNRSLTLIRGECFLEVVHNKSKPFTITYKDLTIADIGTAFNMKLDKNQLIVSVNAGRVELKIENKSLIDLRAGEAAAYLPSINKVQKTTIDNQNYKAYVDHNFNFNNAPLSQVAVDLTSAFHQKIVLVNSDLNAKRITAEFKNQSLKDILQVISNSLNIQTTIKNKVIYLKD